MDPLEIAALVGCGNPVFLEIGCNDGTDTARFIKAMPGIRWYGFEPDPRAAARFIRNFRQPTPQICEFTAAAVSDRDGLERFWLSGGVPPQPPNDGRNDWPEDVKRDWDLSSSLCEPTEHMAYSPWVTFDNRITVASVTLDTWLMAHWDISTIDFIWADTQGSEAKMILGAPRALRRTRFLYTEFYDRPLYRDQPNLEQIKMLLGRSWDLLGIYGGDNALFGNQNL